MGGSAVEQKALFVKQVDKTWQQFKIGLIFNAEVDGYLVWPLVFKTSVAG